MACPFCGIDKEKNRVLKEGEHTVVIFSNPRLMPGHLLVIPKRHVEKLSELKEEERKELIDNVMEFQEKILKKIAPGCDIRENYRPFQKQNDLKVHHLHIHLQPRDLEDELYKGCQIHETKVFKPLNGEEVKSISELLE